MAAARSTVVLALVVAAAVAPLCASAPADASSPAQVCACDAASGLQSWSLPPPAGGPLALKGHADSCLVLSKTAGGVTCDGFCAHLGPCAGAPAWHAVPSEGNGDAVVMLQLNTPPPGQTGTWCADLNTAHNYLQAYKCLNDANQHWTLNATAGRIEAAFESGGCLTAPGGACPKPPPPPPPPFCAQYHPIHVANVYDPSGPLQTPDGVWHVWEDDGGWSHYVSTDLIRWKQASPTTHFSGLTGSVAVTPSGVYAFWPSGDQKGIDTAVATDSPTLNAWTPRGLAIPAPAYAGRNFRDPLRALQLGGKWYVGVGCNNRSQSADLCWFEAADDTLTKFTDVGPLFSTNTTFGQMDGNICWQPTPVHATMMECPDVFPLGDKYMIVGSLFATNQWWIGTITGSPPRFTPDKAPGGQGPSVGLMDYGNGYAAKTGSTMVQTGASRRLVFGFTGWKEPTAVPGCGRYLILPRDVTLGADGSTPRINPIPEVATLHEPGSHAALEHAAPGAGLAVGSLVDLRLTCQLPSAAPMAGVVGVQVLTSADGSQYTTVGYDFAKQAFFADHSKCCAAPSTIVQHAPVPVARLGGLVNMTVLVDGGLVESFLNGLVTLTPLVSPDASKGAPESRTNTVVSTAAGVKCSAQSWRNQALPPITPP